MKEYDRNAGAGAACPPEARRPAVPPRTSGRPAAPPRTVRRRISAFGLALALPFVALPIHEAAAQTAHTDAERLRRIEAYVEQARQDWEVPGLGLAIVRDDSVIFARGFGTRTLGRDEPVDEHTLFAIGSSSKAFTAAAVGMLVDEGRVRWDDPVRRHLPTLEFRDPYVTREIQVRDLLSHTSGLPRYDQLWGTFHYSREEILRRVRYLEPTSSFRSAYGYQNIMFLAAGELVRAVDGRSWDDFVAERIFTPLGMRSSNTSIRLLEGRANVASPHARVQGDVVPIPYRLIDNIGPAGSINSSVREMADWIRLQLGNGEHGGERLLSEGVVREMQTPQTALRRSAQQERNNPYTHFSAYGLGWFLEDYRGRKVVQHGGNIDGMSAMVAMLPGEGVGFVLLENMNSSGLRTPLMYYIFDRFLDAEERDWSDEFLERQRAARARAALAQAASPGGSSGSRIEGTSPSLSLAAYAGVYESGIYGALVISEEAGRLILRGGEGPAIHAELEHWHFDTFRSRNLDPDAGPLRGASRMTLTFSLDARAEPRAVTVSGLGEFLRRAEDGS